MENLLVFVTAAVALVSAPTTAADDFRCNGVAVGTFDNVVVLNGDTCSLQGTVRGNVKVEPGGALFINGATIVGNVQSDRARWIGINCNFGLGCLSTPAVIGGDVQIKGTIGTPPNQPQGNYICDGTRIRGDLQLEENLNRFDVGGTPAECGLGGNFIDGNVQVFRNTAPSPAPSVSIIGNTIGGDLQCKENTPPALQAGNIVGGDVECSLP